jgi:hypothetical protein
MEMIFEPGNLVELYGDAQVHGHSELYTGKFN